MTIAVCLLVGCARPETIAMPAPTTTPTPTTTTTPTMTPRRECHQPGTLKTDKVFFQDTGENHEIAVYLPACYTEDPQAAYPVLYWVNGNFWWQQLYDTTDRLIGQGDVPTFINVLIQIDPNKGFGADAQIIHTIVPYIDSSYRTQPGGWQRSITGYSNGAAIAARVAFQAPDLFGRVAVLSGGIAEGEQEKFTNWISAMPQEQRPEVMFDVGDRDAIIVLTHHLTDLLDTMHYPYTFVQSSGDHGTGFTDDHLENILKWLMVASR